MGARAREGGEGGGKDVAGMGIWCGVVIGAGGTRVGGFVS